MDIDANKKYHEPIKKPQYLNKNKEQNSFYNYNDNCIEVNIKPITAINRLFTNG